MTPDMKHLWAPPTTALARLFAERGHDVRVVGGAVRDAVAGRPANDVDLATDATPAEMLAVGAALGLRTNPSLGEVERDPGLWEKGGLKHGTVPFVLDGETYEVTTLRLDAETDGRWARTVYVKDFRADAARRDFTFNAMSADLGGRLHDYFGGVGDLAEGRVRFVGDAAGRIREGVWHGTWGNGW